MARDIIRVNKKIVDISRFKKSFIFIFLISDYKTKKTP